MKYPSRIIKWIKLEKRNEESDLPEITVASEKVINSFKDLTLNSEDELGSYGDLNIVGQSKIHKKKKYLDVELKVVVKKEIRDKQIAFYVSFNGIDDEKFTLKETIFLKKLKAGKSKSFQLLNHLILSQKLKNKSLKLTMI